MPLPWDHQRAYLVCIDDKKSQVVHEMVSNFHQSWDHFACDVCCLYLDRLCLTNRPVSFENCKPPLGEELLWCSDNGFLLWSLSVATLRHRHLWSDYKLPISLISQATLSLQKTTAPSLGHYKLNTQQTLVVPKHLFWLVSSLEIIMTYDYSGRQSLVMHTHDRNNISDIQLQFMKIENLYMHVSISLASK